MTLRIYMKGTTTANGNVGGTTVIDTSRIEPNDTFKNCWLKITSGTYNGQERQVSSWVKSTGTFTVAVAFGGQILSGVTYEVGVLMPTDPSKIVDDWPPEVTSTKMPGALPYVIAFGKKERKLSAEGYLYIIGWTKASLETNYIIPLRNFTGRKVTLKGDDTRYDGDYIFGFTSEEAAGQTRSFKWKMTFLQGSEYVVL